MREYIEYIAETTLEIHENSFYDYWVFLWGGELVRATVGRDIHQITILTDHLDSSIEEIESFIKRNIGRLVDDEQDFYLSSRD